MSRGNWRYVLAAVGLLAAVVLGGVTSQLYYASKQRQPTYDYQPVSKARFVKNVPSQPIPEGYQPHCQNPQTDKDADLCAQWAAVQQVTESNRLASLNLKLATFSLWATALATLLLVWNLIETRQASRRELRAYVTVKKAIIKNFAVGSRPKMVIEFFNSGQTPAYELRLDALSYWGPADELAAVPPDLPPAQHISRAAVGAQARTRILDTMPVSLDEATFRAVCEGEGAFYVSGAVHYVDVFGRPRVTNFKLQQHFEMVGKLGFCSTGNDAT